MKTASTESDIQNLMRAVLIIFAVTGMCAVPAASQQPNPGLISTLKFMPEGGSAAIFIRPAAILKGPLLQAVFTDEEIETVASWGSVATNYSGTEIEIIAAQFRESNILTTNIAPVYMAVRGVPGTDSLRMQLALHEYQFQQETISRTFQGTSYNLGDQFITDTSLGFLAGPVLSLKELNLKGTFRPDPRTVVLTTDAKTTEAALKAGQGHPSPLALDLSRIPADCQFALVVLVDEDDRVKTGLLYGALTEKPFLQARIDCTSDAAAKTVAEEVESKRIKALEKAQAQGSLLDDFVSKETITDWIQNTAVVTTGSVVTVRSRPTLPGLIEITQRARDSVAWIPKVHFTPLTERLTVELDLLQPVLVDAKKRQLTVKGRTNLAAGTSLQIGAAPDLLQGQTAPFVKSTSPIEIETLVRADGTFVATIQSEQTFKTGDYTITAGCNGKYYYCGPLVQATPWGGLWSPAKITVNASKKFELRTGEKDTVHRKEKRFYQQAVRKISRGLVSLSRIAAADPAKRNRLGGTWSRELQELINACERFESQEAVSHFRGVLTNLWEMEWRLRTQRPAEFQESKQEFETEFESLKQFIKGLP